MSRNEQIQRLYAAFNGRDTDALLAAMSDDEEAVHVYRFSGDLIAEMAIEGHD